MAERRISTMDELIDIVQNDVSGTGYQEERDIRWANLALRLLQQVPDHGVNATEETGITALMAVLSLTGVAEIAVPLLLEMGADVNLRDEQGRTALMFAFSSGYCWANTVKALLDAGADVNAQDIFGQTVMMYKFRCEFFSGGAQVNRMLGERGAVSRGFFATAIGIVKADRARAAWLSRKRKNSLLR